MRVISLGSGSSGNALLVEAGPQQRTKLLIDAGLSGRLILARLLKVGVHPSQLQGVLVTHEHYDHVVGLSTLMRRYNVPIISDPCTFEALAEGLTSGAWRSDSGKLVTTVDEADGEAKGKLDVGSFQRLMVGASCVIGDIEVNSFPVSHDAVAPCGYLLKAGGCRMCMVTDSGEVTPAMLAMMQQADLLIIESNHDRDRLMRGPYPQALKQRILSDKGHLSNVQAAEAIVRTWHADTIRWLWLSHLSRTNNTPSLALNSVKTYLRTAQVSLAQVHISTLPSDIGQSWDSTQLWHATSLWDMEM